MVLPLKSDGVLSAAPRVFLFLSKITPHPYAEPLFFAPRPLLSEGRAARLGRPSDSAASGCCRNGHAPGRPTRKLTPRAGGRQTDAWLRHPPEKKNRGKKNHMWKLPPMHASLNATLDPFRTPAPRESYRDTARGECGPQRRRPPSTGRGVGCNLPPPWSPFSAHASEWTAWNVERYVRRALVLPRLVDIREFQDGKEQLLKCVFEKNKKEQVVVWMRYRGLRHIPLYQEQVQRFMQPFRRAPTPPHHRTPPLPPNEKSEPTRRNGTLADR